MAKGLSSTQKFITFWIVVTGALLFKLTNDRMVAPHMESKVIFLGPGCGHLSYSMGFVKGILDDEILRARLIETKTVFGGVSSGAITASFAMAVLNGVGKMNYWYGAYIRPGVAKMGQQSVFAIGELVEHTSDLFYDIAYNATHDVKYKENLLLHIQNNNNYEINDDMSSRQWNVFPPLQTKIERHSSKLIEHVVSTTTTIEEEGLTMKQTGHGDAGTLITEKSFHKETNTATIEDKEVATSEVVKDNEQNSELLSALTKPETTRAAPKPLPSSYEVSWLANFPIAVTMSPSFKPKFYSYFPTKKDFVSALHASAYVPGMMGVKPWLYINDYLRVFDGFPGSLQIIWPDDYMFISFLPMQPSHFLGKHHLPQYAFDTTPGYGIIGFLTKFWPWGDTKWHDDCYRRGYEDFNRNVELYREKIQVFLDE